LTFLLLNLPINYFAGDLLSVMALRLERTGGGDDDDHDDDDDDDDDSNGDFDLALHEEETASEPTQLEMTTVAHPAEQSPNMHHRHSKTSSPTNSPQPSYSDTLPPIPNLSPSNRGGATRMSVDKFEDEPLNEEGGADDGKHRDDDRNMSSGNNNSMTSDLIGISQAIFESSPSAPLSFSCTPHLVVMFIYYLNLFLVLGDYILVMGRAVSAMDPTICLPTAGAIASILMFAICQFRTMALLGKNVSMASLVAMMIVLGQCLFHHGISHPGDAPTTTNHTLLPVVVDEVPTNSTIWSQFSALASIGFAVGSQKLFLNIRHELQHKEEASRVLAGSLTTYGTAYVVVILLAGKSTSNCLGLLQFETLLLSPNHLTSHSFIDPPSFLFDAIPEGWSRRLAGFLLWCHVAVSYAINSQALCSSMDRFGAAASEQWWASIKPRRRWLALSLTVVVTSYLVSNAVPFFKDLVALIGALTSVPLTLTLPALLYRRFHGIRLWLPQSCWGWANSRQRRRDEGSSIGSYPLLLYSISFLAIGLVGAISSIDEDWLNHGRPFSCQ